MREIDVYAAANKAVREKIGDRVKFYGREISDGFKRPAMFAELVTNGLTYETAARARIDCSYKLTYFQVKVDDADNLKVVREVQEAIGRKLKVAGRFIGVKGYSVDYIGERNNILQITVELNPIYVDAAPKSDAPLADEIFLNEKEVEGCLI